MTNHSELMNFCESASRFFEWLADEALPLWSTIGVDWERGGFIEQLSPQGHPIADVRRARLVARQIFAFKSAGDLGWGGPVDRLIEHGLTALRQHHLAHGEVVPRYFPAEDRGEGAFDLYDQAFMLFGLAHGFAHTTDKQLEDAALSMLGKMRDAWSHEGGFAENRPAEAPLKANPHMHLLEASLAWMEVSNNQVWQALAAELVDLCLSRFLNPLTGGLHEYFDTDWSILRGANDVVEPGHQVEWAWLLVRWAKIRPTQDLERAATRLLRIAEGPGLNRNQNRLINELNADLSHRDARLRLWPQTERIKALVSVYERQGDAERLSEVAQPLREAIDALLGYLDHPIGGSWWEHFDANGAPIVEPARASSLYHIMGAANELARLTGTRLG